MNDLNVQITQVDNSKFPLVTVYVSVVNAKGEPVAINPQELEIREGGKVIPPVILKAPVRLVH